MRRLARDGAGRCTVWMTVGALAACAPDASGPGAGTAGSSAGGDWTAPLAADAPGRFGFGSDASEERVALWDIDVKPDGEGLPPGSGSVAAGREIYELACMQCHGATGTEGPNDRFVAAGDWDPWPPGRVFGAYWPYATTFFDYTRRAMPQATPGSLSDDDVYAITAYVLHLNGMLPEDAVLDSASLVAIEMPGRDRFVPDNRTGGPEIR